MRKCIIVTIIILWHFKLDAQEKFDFGGSGGVSYYMGDINSHKFPYMPAPAFGALVLYNITNRHAISFALNKMSLSGADELNKNMFYQVRNKSFTTSLYSVESQFVFNFLPYENMTKARENITFFTAGGLGYSIISNTNSGAKQHLSLPLTIGAQYNIIKMVTLGVKWTYYKTFNDKIDGVKTLENNLYESIIHNNDWYSYMGIFIIFKPFKERTKCPVYWN